MLTGGLKELCLMNNIDLDLAALRTKMDGAPEGYISRECYEAAKMRADRLEDMWRAEHEENKKMKSLIETICQAIRGFNEVIDRANKKGHVENDKD